MATDDCRNRPSGGGVFRIFQQSMKELRTIKDKGSDRRYGGPESTDYSRPKDHFRSNKVQEVKRSPTKVMNFHRRDSKITYKGGVYDKATFEARPSENGNFPSNFERAQAIPGGFSSRKHKPFPKRRMGRNEMGTRESTAFCRPSAKTRQNIMVKKTPTPEKQTLTVENKVQSKKEDWSEELIDVIVDSNLNIIAKVESSLPKIYEESISQKGLIHVENCWTVSNVTNETDSQQNLNSDEVSQSHQYVTDNENNYKSDRTDSCFNQKDVNRNVENSLKLVPGCENTVDTDSSVLSKVIGSFNDHVDILANLTNNIENLTNNSVIVNKVCGIQEKDRELQADNLKLYVENNHNNSIVGNSSQKTLKEDKKDLSSEDWSSDLEEVNVDLFIQKTVDFNLPPKDLHEKSELTTKSNQVLSDFNEKGGGISADNLISYPLEAALSNSRERYGQKASKNDTVEAPVFVENHSVETLDRDYVDCSNSQACNTSDDLNKDCSMSVLKQIPDSPVKLEIKALAQKDQLETEGSSQVVISCEMPVEKLESNLDSKLTSSLKIPFKTLSDDNILIHLYENLCLNDKESLESENEVFILSCKSCPETGVSCLTRDANKKDVSFKEYKEVLKEIDSSILEVSETEENSDEAVTEPQEISACLVRSSSPVPNKVLHSYNFMEKLKDSENSFKQDLEKEPSDLVIRKNFNQCSNGVMSCTVKTRSKGNSNIAGQSSEVVDCETKTDPLRFYEVDHTCKIVEKRIEKSPVSNKQTKDAETKQLDNKANLNHVIGRGTELHEHGSYNAQGHFRSRNDKFSHPNRYTASDTGFFQENFSHPRNNLIPPRFMKQHYPLSVSINRFNSGKVQEMMTSSVHSATHKSFCHSYKRGFPKRTKIYGSWLKAHSGENRNKSNNKVMSMNRAVVTGKPLTDCTDVGHNKKEFEFAKTSETNTHVPENWHEEIDETLEFFGKTKLSTDIATVRREQPVANPGNVSITKGEPLCEENKCKKGKVHLTEEVLPILQEDSVKHTEVSFENNNETYRSQTLTMKIPYLPPSPDRMEQASFISYMAKNEVDLMKSRSTSNIDEQKSADSDTKYSNQVKPLDVQSDQSSKAEKQTGPVLENDTEVCDNSYGKEYRQIADGYAIINGCSESKQKQNVIEMEVMNNEDETDSSRQGNKYILMNVKSPKSENRQVINSEVVLENIVETDSIQNAHGMENFDENNSNDIEIPYVKTEYSVSVNSSNKCTNFADISKDTVSEYSVKSIAEEEVLDEKNEVNRMQNIIEKGRLEGFDDQRYLGYSIWQADQEQSYANQVYSAHWQYYQPSYYYSDQYRSWYEQVYVPNCQRYMQFYGYNEVPSDTYWQGYFTDLQPQHFSGIDFGKVKEAAKHTSSRSKHLHRQYPQEQVKESKTHILNKHVPSNETLSHDRGSKENIIENKLSDYWADHMPEWVEKQSKVAKMKKETQAVGQNEPYPESQDDIKGSEPFESVTAFNLKKEKQAEKEVEGHRAEVLMRFPGSRPEKNQFQHCHHTSEVRTNTFDHPYKKGNRTEQANENSNTAVLSKTKAVLEVSETRKRQTNKDNSLLDLTASDSFVVLGSTDNDFNSTQQKQDCTCGPDGIQYWLWKTCKCSAGRIPSLEDIVPVFPEDRSVDQGYQSFDSLGEHGAVVVKRKDHSQDRHPLPVFFSTIPPTIHYSGEVRHSTPQPADRQPELDSQERLQEEFKNQEGLHKAMYSLKISRSDRKIGPPPGFKIGPQSLARDKLQHDEPSAVDQKSSEMELFESDTTTGKGVLVDVNENAMNDPKNCEQRQRSGDKLRHQVDNKLKEIIEISRARNESFKAAKMKSCTQKEGAENLLRTVTDTGKLNAADPRIVLTRKKNSEEETESINNVSFEETGKHPLREQIDKIQNKSRLKTFVKQNAAFKDRFRSDLKESPPHSVETSSGVWKVEKMLFSDSHKKNNVFDSSNPFDAESGNRSNVQDLRNRNQEVLKLTVKGDEKNDKSGDESSDFECSVSLKILKGKQRSCTVSMSDSAADIELKTSSSNEDEILDDVRSQSAEEKESSDIKEHDIVEGNLTEQGFMCRKLEGITCNKGIDLNNNYMAEFPPRQPGFASAGYRMPYRLSHTSSPFDNRIRCSPLNMRSPTNFSERSFMDSKWGNTRFESTSKMTLPLWMNARDPVFRPRSFEETPLFPSPWCMLPPPPPFPAPAAVNEGQRQIYRPVYEQIISDQGQCESKSFKSTSPPSKTTLDVTDITPDLEKKATFSGKASVGANKYVDKSLSKSKLVDYNSSDGDEEIGDFEVTSLDSDEIENVRAKETPIPSVSVESDKFKHANKRFKLGSPETIRKVQNCKSDIEFSLEEFPDSNTVTKKATPQKCAQLMRRPMRKLKQGVLKPFISESVDLEQPKQLDKEKRNMMLSEVVAASLMKSEPNQADEYNATGAPREELYGTNYQPNVPQYPPPLPPFPASPFWSMYLTNSKSALEGKEPSEVTSSSTHLVQGTSPAYSSWKCGLSSSPGWRQSPRSLFSPSETDSENQSKKSDGLKQFKRFHNFGVKYIDTHCHLDFLFNRSGFNGNLKAYMEENPETFPETFEGCVAIFCYPSSFSRNDKVLQRLVEEGNVWFAMGCHPKMATDFTEKAEWGLKQCLKHAKCVALGEIGLDYSGTFQRHEEIQKAVFKRQIGIALKMNKPLVIHCRDAEEDCLEIMKELVPRNHKIHCHCFTGGYASAQLWMDAFPNLLIGLTPLVTYPSARPSHDLARKIPLNKLLLETDAPYFVPRCRPRLDLEFSNPGFAITVAKAVAQYQEIPVAMVLRQCRVNTKFMYGI